MSFDWGPHFIVPSEGLTKFSGVVRLREKFKEESLRKELDSLGLSGAIVKVTNPWYYRRKNTDTWVKIGESDDESENFPVRWDTSNLENGQYEVLGMMHVFVKRENEEQVIAGQNIVEVTVEN
ncbi:MAG: hypothetical protein GWN64_19910 [Candidatus Thorarchaeota archaeon]|nr:hypothetical protein [Candidatus Thorarchaeota archaeon]